MDSPGQDGFQAQTPAAQQPTQEQDPPCLLQSHPDQGQSLYTVVLTLSHQLCRFIMLALVAF